MALLPSIALLSSSLARPSNVPSFPPSPDFDSNATSCESILLSSLKNKRSRSHRQTIQPQIPIMIAVKSENTMRSKKWYVYVEEGDTGSTNSQPMISTTTTTEATPGATYCVTNRIRQSQSMRTSVG